MKMHVSGANLLIFYEVAYLFPIFHHGGLFFMGDGLAVENKFVILP